MNPKASVLMMYPTAYVRHVGKRFQIARKRTDDDEKSSMDYVLLGPSRSTEGKAWQAAADKLKQHG
jgi:hypothetical protein